MIGFCGNLSIGQDASNGQTIKTRNVYSEIKKERPQLSIEIIDTYKIHKNPVFEMLRLYLVASQAASMVILPAQSAISILAVILFLVRKEKDTHYIVIGGWLPELLEKKKWLLNRVSEYKGIYVETKSMYDQLSRLGLGNVYVLPNFKPLKLRKEEGKHTPYKFCTFSRISKEKGIELAVQAIKRIKRDHPELPIELDIYGKPDDDYLVSFDLMRKEFPSFITYKGILPSELAESVLSDYYALLFPTYYAGEGFPGTVIDAYSAGLPVLASDWKYNSEVVEDGVTGFIYNAKDLDALVTVIEYSINNDEEIKGMRRVCKERVRQYLPDNAMKEFFTLL